MSSSCQEILEEYIPFSRTLAGKRWQIVADQMLAALGARIGRFVKSQDPYEVLDPAALDEATELWETAKPQAVTYIQFL